MEELLIITGACGVGKSTIAKAWAALKKGATVDCDYLTEWIYKENFPNWTLEEEKFIANLASKIAVEYLKCGMSTSIENVWSPVGVEILKKEILAQIKVKVKVVWLFCEIKENHKRDQQRIPENQMKERVDAVNKELELHTWPAYVHKFNTTNLTIDQTIEMIENL